MEEKKINAVMDEGFEKLLKKVGIFDQFENGYFRCNFCEKVMTKENVGIILPLREENKVKLVFYCDDILCLQSYMNRKGK